MSLLNKLFKREEIKGYIYDDSIDEKRLTVLKKFCADNEIALADLTLLDMALTHSSYANERGGETADYERLEFLGDSVIGLTVVEYLYNQYPEMSEGEMTRIKSDVVSQASLSEVAKNLRLSRLLNLGKAELLGQGRRKPSILSDVFESVVGAIFLSSTSYQTKDFILRQLTPPIKDIVKRGNIDDNKSLLQKKVNRRFGVNPTYRVIKKTGREHNYEFIMAVFIKKKKYGEGRGRNKKSAEMKAAQKTLKMLRSSKQSGNKR
jgi:ribonuclease-3